MWTACPRTTLSSEHNGKGPKLPGPFPPRRKSYIRATVGVLRAPHRTVQIGMTANRVLMPWFAVVLRGRLNVGLLSDPYGQNDVFKRARGTSMNTELSFWVGAQ